MSKYPPTAELLESDIEYNTTAGSALLGDSRALLQELPDDCIDLIVTSPPSAHQQQKVHDNKDQDPYNDWFLEFVSEIRRVLQPYGSLVIEIGGTFKKEYPERSISQFKLLNQIVDQGEMHLAQDFYLYNPTKLPNPAEWVAKRRVRVTDAITHIWWLTPEINRNSAVKEGEYPYPEADNRRVLQEYSNSQKELIETGDFTAGKRNSGWDMNSPSYASKNEGSIPNNLIEDSNTAHSTHYLRMCKEFNFEPHPARTPHKIPEFFIDFLTPNSPYDDWDNGEFDKPIILDIFAGSNITGKIAEEKGRYWLAFEKEKKYLEASEFRFRNENEIREKMNGI